MTRDDWNNEYIGTFTNEPRTFSKKWSWHYSQSPFVQLPIKNTGGRRYPIDSYKKGGPQSTNMYKRAYPITYDGYVNNLGDL